MPKKTPHPHVAWRDGRPRFVPGPALRAAGHDGRDLRHPDGRWFTRGEAVDWSDAFCLSLADQKAARPRSRRRRKRLPGPAAAASAMTAPPAAVLPAVPAGGLTVAALVERWQHPQTGAPKFRADFPRRYSPHTLRFWRTHARAIEADHPLIWNCPVDWLRRADVAAMLDEMALQRGLATARGAARTLSAAISWALRRGLVARPDNPVLAQGIEQPPPRIRIASRGEFAALVAAADATGRPEIGDMCHLAVWTGQRQADRLAFRDGGRDEHGRRIFRQAKTGAVVAIRDTPELAARLAAAAERRRQARAAALLAAGPDGRQAADGTWAHAVLDERRWEPFGEFHYRKIFQCVRAAAVAGVPDQDGGWAVAPCPTLADFRDQDFRDTAVTWLARAGATLPEICAVTGHSLASATQVLRHYLALDAGMADAAIAKMVAAHERALS